jgi:hypothetical protein
MTYYYDKLKYQIQEKYLIKLTVVQLTPINTFNTSKLILLISEPPIATNIVRLFLLIRRFFGLNQRVRLSAY